MHQLDDICQKVLAMDKHNMDDFQRDMRRDCKDQLRDLVHEDDDKAYRAQHPESQSLASVADSQSGVVLPVVVFLAGFVAAAHAFWVFRRPTLSEALWRPTTR